MTPTLTGNMAHRCPTIPPSLKSALDDRQEVNVFQKFQTSSTLKQVLPDCGVVTEYDPEHSAWAVSSAK